MAAGIRGRCTFYKAVGDVFGTIKIALIRMLEDEA